MSKAISTRPTKPLKIYKSVGGIPDEIPSSENNNTWNNYRHHVEIFYGFLHLNRDLKRFRF